MRRSIAVLATVPILLAGCGGGAEPDTAAPSLEPVPVDDAPSPTPDASPAPVPSPSPTPGAGPAPSPVPSPSPSGSEERLLAGTSRMVEVEEDVFVVGASPDGTNIHAFVPDEDGFRCEESFPTSLQLLDVGTGALRPAVATPGFPVDVLTPRTDGSWLSESGCEGFLGRVAIVDVAPDGVVTVREEVELGGLDVFGITAVAAVPGEDLLVVSRSTEDFAGELLTVDLDGTPLGPPLPLDQEHHQLWATTTGVYGLAFSDGSRPDLVEVTTGRTYPGYDSVQRTPDGEELLLAGDAGVAVLRPDGTLDRWVDDVIGDELFWSAPAYVTADRLLVVRDPFGTSALTLVGPQGVLGELGTSVSDFPRAQVVADGTRVVYATYDDVDFSSDVVVVDLP